MEVGLDPVHVVGRVNGAIIDPVGRIWGRVVSEDAVVELVQVVFANLVVVPKFEKRHQTQQTRQQNKQRATNVKLTVSDYSSLRLQSFNNSKRNSRLKVIMS